MAAAIGLGIARFAYALVLPAMRTDLVWTYGEAGWLNTTNAIGYLIGAVTASRAASALGTRAMTGWGVVACLVSLAACAVLRDFVALNAARILAGIGGAYAFVGGGVLVSRLASEAPDRAGLLLGVYYAMPGLGIAASGVVVPTVLASEGLEGWPFAWVALAVFCLPMAAFHMLGTRSLEAEPPRSAGAPPDLAQWWIGTAYFLFGAGYIGYMTFMIARVRDGGGGSVEQGAFWVTIGAGAIVSAWAWRGVLDRLVGGRAFGLLCAICATGAAVPVAGEGAALHLLSAALFGSTFFSVVASTTAFVRRNYAQASWGRGIGLMTTSFGVGQIVGPIAIGWLNDATGSLQAGMAVSAALLFAGALVALPQGDVSSGRRPA